ncbi:replication initiation protein [Ligilactobacillus acidipiscis]|uniref:Replication protein A1 n=1 Tax=Ligilactobacillus acidipiscis TaxID=89059 RepID=A0A0R2JQV0_9LACO|nr:replication initiation protein [Ligilactobacillus acidipiscis]KRN76596.1 replication protein A1 [Ligilactobacillus acidipiscis]
MANELVKYDNRLNSIPLRRFNSREMNLFFSIASRIIDKGTNDVSFSFTQLKYLSQYKNHNGRFIEDLEKVYDKLLSLSARNDDGNKIVRFVAFTKYEIERSTETVTIAVNPDFKGLFNELRTWTRFSLEQFASLKSTYSKTAFRLLKQYRTVGKRNFKMSEFRELLDIPTSYRTDAIDRRVLKPIKEELTPIFRGLKIKKRHEGHGGKITGYEFTWKPEANNEDDFLKSSWYEIRKKIMNIENNNELTNIEKENAKKRVYKNYSKKPIKQKETLPDKDQKSQISEEERLQLRQEINERLKILGIDNSPKT